MEREDRKLVQVILKKGLYYYRSECEENGRVLRGINRYEALAVYQTENSGYGSICIQPIRTRIDFNGGYVNPDDCFCGFCKNVTIENVWEAIRVNIFEIGDLESALSFTMDQIRDFVHFEEGYVRSSYIKNMEKQFEEL